MGRIFHQVVRRAVCQRADSVCCLDEPAYCLLLRQHGGMPGHPVRVCDHPVQEDARPHAAVEHDHGAAGDAGSDHRFVAVAAVCADGPVDWLAGGSWHGDDLDCSHDLLQCLCGGGGECTVAGGGFVH